MAGAGPNPIYWQETVPASDGDAVSHKDSQDWGGSSVLDGGSPHFNHWTSTSAFPMTFGSEGTAGAAVDGAVFAPPPQQSPAAPQQHPLAPQAQPAATPNQAQPQPQQAPPPSPQQSNATPPEATLRSLVRPKMASSVSADQVPSTAIYVKNLEPVTTEEDLKAVFEPYLQGGQILIVPYFERGVAFVDLASTEAVARAVTASRSSGIKIRDTQLIVEPSKKPVRPSGLRAMSLKQVRKATHHTNLSSGGSLSPPNHHNSGGANTLTPHAAGKDSTKNAAHNGPKLPGSGGRNSRGARALACWCVQEMFVSQPSPQTQQQPQGQVYPTLPERRMVAVFVQKEDAVAAANTLWTHLKANTGTLASYCYQEIREDASNGIFYRRLDSGSSQEIRQVTVEAPALLNPGSGDLRDLTSVFLRPPHPPAHSSPTPPPPPAPAPGSWQPTPAPVGLTYVD